MRGNYQINCLRMDDTKKNSESTATPVSTGVAETPAQTTPEVTATPEVKVGTSEPVVAPVTPSTVAVAEVAAPAVTPVETVPAAPEEVTSGSATPSGPVWQGYAIAAVIIALMMAGVWYVLERDGRVTTTIFTDTLPSLFAGDPAAAQVARVNDAILTAARLQPSIDQITQSAVQQGADPNDPAIAAEIRTQALTMLINTELLLQAAAADGIVVTDEEVAERLAQVETQVGGAEALAAELETAGVTMEQLRGDIVTEITIQTLLASVVGEEEIAVTEEEITELYESAGGEAAGIPPLEEVRDQVIAQIQQTKEQTLVQEYLDMLRLNAEIEEFNP